LAHISKEETWKYHTGEGNLYKQLDKRFKKVNLNNSKEELFNTNLMVYFSKETT
jgi:hypothetical protein